MGSLDPDVEFVSADNHITPGEVVSDSPSVVHIPAEQKTFSRMKRKSATSLRISKNGIGELGDTRRGDDSEFFVPGGPESRKVGKNTGIPTPRAPLETDVEEVFPSEKNMKTAAEDSIWEPDSHRTRSSKSPPLDCNAEVLRLDRARRQGDDGCKRKVKRVGSISAARDKIRSPLKRREDHTIHIDDDDEGAESAEPTDLVDDDPPARPSRIMRTRGAARQAAAAEAAAVAVDPKQKERREKVEKALDLAKENIEQELKDLTSTEIGYNGPRHLIFMYPPGGRGKIRVTAEERERLNLRKYLNDSIIDFYLKYLETDLNHRRPPNSKHVKFFSSFFFGVLRREKRNEVEAPRGGAKPSSIDYNGVKNWTKRVDIFDTDFVIVPICDSYHWSLIIVANLKQMEHILATEEQVPSKPDDPRSPKIVYMDSLDPKRGVDFANSMRHYLVEEWLTRKKQCNPEKVDELRIETVKRFRRAIPTLRPNVPIQNNEYDCGLYLLKSLSMFLDNTDDFMESMLRGSKDMRDSYDSGDISNLRKGISVLMDNFEEEWNINHKRPAEPNLEAEPDITEAEDLPVADSPKDENVTSETEANGEDADDSLKCENPSAIKELFEGVPQSGLSEGSSVLEKINRVTENNEIDSGDIYKWEHVPQKASKQTSKLKRSEVQLCTVNDDPMNEDVQTIDGSDEADGTAMEVDGIDEESGGDFGQRQLENAEFRRSRGSNIIGNDEGAEDLIFVEEQTPNAGVVTDQQVYKMEVETVEDGSHDFQQGQKMELEVARGESYENSFAPELNDVVGTRSKRKRKRINENNQAHEPVGFSSGCSQQNRCFHLLEDSQVEETLDEGKVEDIDLIPEVTMRRRKHRNEKFKQKERHTPAVGYGGGHRSLESGSRVQLERRNEMRTSMGRAKSKVRKERSSTVEIVPDSDDSAFGEEVETLDHEGTREILKRDCTSRLEDSVMMDVDDDDCGSVEV